jgi:gliding motility-associated-like protein
MVTLITISNQGCIDSVSQSVEVFKNPIASITTVPSSNQICVYESFKFKGTSSIPNAYSIVYFYWDFGDGTVSTLPNPSPKSYANPGNYVVKLRITNSNGCSDSISINVIVMIKPKAEFSADPVCFNEVTLFKDSSTSIGSTYYWNFGDPLSGANNTSTLSNPSHTFTKSGVFNVWLSITNNLGCVDSINKPITVWALPEFTFTANPLKLKLSNGVVNFTNRSQLGQYISMNFGDGQSMDWTTQTNWIHKYTDTGVYILLLNIKDIHNCTAQIQDTIVIEEDFNVFVPSAFSPNHDGKNEGFMPILTFVKDYNLLIYNRWGQLIFSTNESECNESNPCGWDGTYKGEPVQEDVYIYTMRIFDKNNKEHSMKGSFALIR